MVIVPIDAPGVKIVRMVPIFGQLHEPHGHGQILFEDVRVPVDHFIAGAGSGFQIAQGNDFFEQVCKIRALRRIWATTMKERFQAQDPRSMHVRIHTHTSGVELTAQQPMVNLIRTTLHAFGAALSGTQAMEVSAYDEALAISTEEAATLALRVQQVIQEETNITAVSDPYTVAQAVRSGAASYLNKTDLSPDRLVQTVMDVLNSSDDNGNTVVVEPEQNLGPEQLVLLPAGATVLVDEPVSFTASASLRAICMATSRAISINASGGTTRFTSPWASASSGVTRSSPVSSHSLAFLGPAIHGSTSATIPLPNFTSGAPRRQPSAAMVTSQATAISIALPRQ